MRYWELADRAVLGVAEVEVAVKLTAFPWNTSDASMSAKAYLAVISCIWF